jgi:hypothetical protein
VHKVETIGDAYMCVTGHDGIGDHAQRMSAFAREMIEVCNRVKLPYQGSTQQSPESMDAHGSRNLASASSDVPSKKLQIRVGGGHDTLQLDIPD